MSKSLSFQRTPDKECDALEIQEFNGCTVQCEVRRLPFKTWVLQGTGGASEESHDVNDPHDSNDDGQSDAHNNEETKDKEEVEGRMCECK